MTDRMRINRFLARAGVASRRKSDKLVESGAVSINGVVATTGDSVNPDSDIVTVNGQEVELHQTETTLIFYKPRAVLSAMSDDRGRRTVADFLPNINGLAPAGRLDFDVSGIMLFSTDGSLIYRLTHPSFQVEKIYRAEVRGTVLQTEIQSMLSGFMIENHLCKAARATIESSDYHRSSLLIVMTEGRKREVKLLCEAIDHEVLALKRVSFAGLTLDGLKAGEYRLLTTEECQRLKELGT